MVERQLPKLKAVSSSLITRSNYIRRRVEKILCLLFLLFYHENRKYDIRFSW